MKTLLINSTAGQTCNQLWSYAIHHKAHKESKCSVRYSPITIDSGISIRDNAVLSGTFFGSKYLLNYLNAKRKGSSRIVQFINLFLRSSNQVHLLDNWHHLNWLLNKIDNSTIQLTDIFEFSGLTDSRVHKIALHARLGDYATWRNGLYYRSPLEYIDLAKILSDINGNIPVVIYTNEPNRFKNLPDQIELSEGQTAAEDLCSMATCVKIYGPPSTFSMTASNIGKTPLKWFLSKNWIEELSDSRDEEVAIGFYQFQTHSIGDSNSSSLYNPCPHKVPHIWTTTRITSL